MCRSARLVLLAPVILSVATCASGPAGISDAPGPSARTELTIFGAASLKDALAEVEAAYESSRPGVAITVSTDSSSALETQIEQGAPADVFLSADTINPQKLVDAGLAAGRPVPFAGNTLTIIVPSANPAGIRSPIDLARDGVKVVAAGDEVPITRYALEAIEQLARQPGYPVDFAARYAANVVSREDSVKAVLAKIELGEGDAGIVYVTDARASSEVSSIELPADARIPATYAGVVVGSSAYRAAATAFLNWLAGPGGQAVLGRSGFLPPPG